MKTKETILKEIFRNDPFGLLGEKTMPTEARDLLIENISFALNGGMWDNLKGFIKSENSLSNIELNPDSPIWSEIENFIADKILKDNQINIME
tara:strand:+ start:17 stop:295 length:279 start_codon:yes stop_codon:yes gene_type:complete